VATIFTRGGKGKQGGRYYISYFDHKGKRQSRSARTTDKGTAERIAAKLEADAALRRDGVVDPELDAICEQSRRLVDPLVSVTKPNPKADRRRERRMLLPEEWQWLRATSVDWVERFGMAAKERLLLYAVAIQTGLRSSELRSLSRGRLFLDGDQPFVTCKAGSTKNRKDARQYISAGIGTRTCGPHRDEGAPSTGFLDARGD
jgi:integrase